MTATVENEQGEQFQVDSETGEYLNPPDVERAATRAGAALATKIARVMAEMSHVPKLGWNEHQRYRYATESDIVDMARRAMAKHNLVLIPTGVSDGDVKEGKTARGNVNYLTTIRVEYLLIDGDSGEQMPIEIVATGQDTGEKGIYKAYTGAKKYLLLQLFLMSTGEDDAEREPAQNTAPEQQAQPQQQKQAQPQQQRSEESIALSTTQQQKSIYIAGDKAGLSEDDVKEQWLKTFYKVDSAKDLTEQNARELIQFLYLLPFVERLEATDDQADIEDCRTRAYDRKLLDRPKRWIDKKLAEAEERLWPTGEEVDTHDGE